MERKKRMCWSYHQNVLEMFLPLPTKYDVLDKQGTPQYHFHFTK